MKKAFLFLFLFYVLLYTAKSQPANDDCSGAIVLTDLNDWCSADGAYTNVGGTISISTKPDCWTGSNPSNDVWFKFTAVASAVNIKIDATTGGTGMLIKPQITLMESDGTCTIGNMIQRGCTEFPSTNTMYASLYVSGLFIGTEYYILVDGYNTNVGKFKVCINNFEPPTAPGQDCVDASTLCSKNTFTQQKLVGAGNDEIQSAGTCLTSEHNSVWYKWVAKDAGTITYSIEPLIPNDDLDWVLYEIPAGGCGSKIKLSCNGSSCDGPTGLNATSTTTSVNGGCVSATDLFNKQLTQVAGKTYALFIDNFTDASTGKNNGFTISFGGTGNFVGPESFFSIAPSAPYCTGDNITFTSSALGSPTIHHWDFGDGASIDTAITAGPHTVKYTTPGTKTIVYRVGNGTCEDMSFQTITVTDCCIAPTISSQPISVNQCPGTAATLSVTASGTGLTYQWRKNNVNINGATNSTYPIAAISASDTGSYTCVVYSNITCSDTTNIATVTMVSPSPVGITIAAVPNTPICAGTSVTFTATPTNGGSSPSYKWLKNGSVINGETNPTYTTTGLANNDIITCELTSNLTCVTGNPATSAGFTAVVNPNLPVSIVISANPGNSICNGESVTFTATPTNGGTLPQYQWLKNGTPVSGETNATYTTTTLANNDVISCTLTSNATCPTGNPATSNNITMTTLSLPVSVTISAQPSEICIGENLTYTASGVNSGTSPTYQWRVNGTNVGTNSSTYSSTTFNHGDIVDCILTSNALCATGSPATSNLDTVVVNPLPTIAIIPSDTVGCAPFLVSFTASATPAAAQTYAWNFGNGATSTDINPSTTYNNAGQYTVSATITDVKGCTNSITKTNLITASPIPSVDFTFTPEVGYANKLSTFTSTFSGGGSSLWKWNFGDGSALATEQVPIATHTYTHTQVFSVTHTVVNEFGCTNSITKPYTVIIDIIIPNIFTPNQDGSNDTFVIEGVQFMENAGLKVYNRWGGMVYKADSYKNDWDGEDLPDGVYFYVLTLPDYITTETFNGTVTILH